ncbi:hypothetical protein [Methylocystis parvus]|uniref:hypothetical protein n=1 Tax=Methylocystis parvus TaxID=134 RepID=UPI003C76D0CD
MAKELMNAYGVEPPSPHKHLVSDAAVFGALLAGPLAWLAQLLLNYGLASHACFPRETPRETLAQGWIWLHSGLLAINLAALAVAIAGTVAAFFLWRRTREEAEGDHARLLEAGQGRTRFFAIWGVWSGVWFILQILFGLIAVIGAPGCGS